MNIFRFLFYTFFICTSLYSNQLPHENIININNDISKKEILSKTKIFIDKSQQLDILSIKKKKFISNSNDVLSYGLSPKFNVWIKIVLHNSSSKSIVKYIEYANPLTTNLEFYDGKKIYKDGLLQFNKQRDSFHPTFKVVLNPNETKELYLKASSKITTLIIKLNLLSEKELFIQTNKKNMFLSMFFAAMLILTLYNFVIYLFTKDKNYLFYVLYMIGAMIHQFVYTGYGFIHLMPQELITLSIKYAGLLVAFPIFVFALLVQSFLKTSQYPVWNKFIVYYLVAFPFLIGIFFIFDSIAQFRNIFSILLLLLVMSVTIYASLKKNRQAYFVLVGWIALTFAFVIMYLSSAGIVDLFQYFEYFVELALLFEAILFSIALADKINQLQREKNLANMELILKQATETQKLENLVNKKTNELKEALESKSLLLKELNHRVKNNMQTIVSLIRLQNDNLIDKKTKDILEVIQNRINAMGCVHELLYQQTDISTIKTKEYFELLVDELEESIDNEKVTINYKVDKSLPAEDAVYCGLIINEFITNSLKYAFKKQDKGVINIEFHEKSQQKYLIIYDNGIGFDKNINSNGLGLLLIQTLATKQLKGSYKLDSKNGVKVEILWN